MEHLFGSNPSDRLNPSFDLEGEEMATELVPVVMAPPAYASPDPATAGARLVAVEDSPHELSEDYGASVLDTPTGDGAVVDTDYFPTTMTPQEQQEAAAGKEAEGLDADRDKWSKANWQVKARSYGLAVGGSKDKLRERVESYEEELQADKDMTAEEWKGEIEGAESADDLAAIRERYAATGESYSTVESAFEKAQAEFDGENGNGS